MPISSRRTRRLLKLLFKIPRKGFWHWIGTLVIPIIATAGCFALAYFLYENEDTRPWSWLPILYLWIERSHSNLEREMKRVCESNDRVLQRMYKLGLSFSQMRLDNPRVLVDMEDFVREAQRHMDRQRQHEAQRARRRR